MMAHLQDKVINGRSLNVGQALSGESQNNIAQINPQEDFNKHGYASSPGDNWALFCFPPTGFENLVISSWVLNMLSDTSDGIYDYLVFTPRISYSSHYFDYTGIVCAYLYAPNGTYVTNTSHMYFSA
jgi:hypothetical protein